MSRPWGTAACHWTPCHWTPCWTTQLTYIHMQQSLSSVFICSLNWLICLLVPYVLNILLALPSWERGLVGTVFCLLILLGLADVYVAYNWPSALRQTGSKTHHAQITVMGWAERRLEICLHAVTSTVSCSHGGDEAHISCAIKAAEDDSVVMVSWLLGE